MKDDAVLLDGFLALVAWIAVRIRKSNPHVSFGELFMAGTGARITRTGKSTGQDSSSCGSRAFAASTLSE